MGRILLALEQKGVNVSRFTVRRAMKKGGLLKAPARRPQGLTKADAAAQKAENLIRRNFTAAAPNQKWLTDITQVPCADGLLQRRNCRTLYGRQHEKGAVHPRV